MPRTTLIIAAGLLCIALPLAGASADDYYGVIAYSESTRQYGYAYGYRDLESATSDAIENAEASDAKMLLYVRNRFAALARSRTDDSYGYASGDTKSEAEQQAIQNLRKYGDDPYLAVSISAFPDAIQKQKRLRDEGLELLRSRQYTPASSRLNEAWLAAPDASDVSEIKYHLGVSEYRAGRLQNAYQWWESSIDEDLEHRCPRAAKCVLFLASGHPDWVLQDAQQELLNPGPSADHTVSMAIYGYLAARQTGKDALANLFLERGAVLSAGADWSATVLSYLQGRISAAKLFELAKSSQEEYRMRDAQMYVGLMMAFDGRYSAALPHLEWTARNEDQTRAEHLMTAAVLKHVEAKQQPR